MSQQDFAFCQEISAAGALAPVAGQFSICIFKRFAKPGNAELDSHLVARGDAWAYKVTDEG